jgi:hypothetical protein
MNAWRVRNKSEHGEELEVRMCGWIMAGKLEQKKSNGKCT